MLENAADSVGTPMEGAVEIGGKSYVASTVGPFECLSVGDTLIRVAGAYGECAALTWLTEQGTAHLTWGELLLRARSAAAALSGYVGLGDRVVLMAPNGVSWIVANYACALAGAAIVPISPMSTAPEIDHVLGQVSAQVILAVEVLNGIAVRDRAEQAAVRAMSSPVVLDIDSISNSVDAGDVELPVVSPDEQYLIQHTSGTTGKPKAAVLTHRAALGSATYFAGGVDAQPSDIWFNPLPLYHVGASVAGVLAALATASAYVVVDRFNAAGAVRAIRELSPTIVGLVPTMVLDLLDLDGVGPVDFTTVRAVVGGASAVDPGMIERVERDLGLQFLVGYGQSEAPCIAMSSELDPTDVRISTLGHPLPGRDICIVMDNGELADVGTVGELCVRGCLVMSGYLQPDGSLEDSRGDHDWMHTGDLCSLDDTGVLRFHARRREVIIRGGSNVYPAEVEATLLAHEAVHEAAVFGVPDGRMGEVVAAAVILNPGATVTADDLSAFCRQLISAGKVPERWHFVTDMPRTSTGKVRKFELQALL